MTTQLASPPFWPSRRLWLKFFIGFVYVPLLFALLIWVFVRGLFSPSSEQVLYAIPFALILIGGPISIGLLLSPSWRGAGAGCLAMVSMLLAWNLIGYLGLQNQFFGLDESHVFAVISGIGIIVFEFIVRDITKQSELIGLGIGIGAGFLISSLFVSLFSPDFSSIFGIVYWSIQFALVWLSAFFFPEWLSRKVSWGGVVVWIVLVAAVFGLSFTLMK